MEETFCHTGNNIRTIRELPGIKQATLAFALKIAQAEM